MAYELKKDGEYCVYLRKSRADADLEKINKMETLARHEGILADLAERLGISISRTYREVVSGETIEDRPQVKELLTAVANGRYDGVLVMEVERLARGDAKDQGTLADAFKFSKTKIITPMRTYDPCDQADMDYLEFGLFMSRKEFQTIRRRLQTGIDTSVAEGQFLGTYAPFGYDKHSEGRVKTLVKNEDASIVVAMFEWADEGVKSMEIARNLQQMGVPTVRGAKEWGKGSVRCILKNEAYIGKIRWRHVATMRDFDPDTMKHRKYRKLTHDYLLFDGLHAPIVDEELFYRVQDKITWGTSEREQYAMKNPFSGLIRCSKCGHSMIRQKNYQNGVYVCDRIIHQASDLCTMRGVHLDRLTELVVSALTECIEEFEVKASNEGIKREMELAIEAINRLESEIENADKAIDMLLDRLEREVITESDFKRRRVALEERRASLVESLRDHRENIPEAVKYEEMLMSSKLAIETILDEDVSAKEKNILLKELISRIDYANEDGNPTLDIFFR